MAKTPLLQFDLIEAPTHLMREEIIEFQRQVEARILGQLGPNGIITTSTDGFVIDNTTPATAGVPVQQSGRMRWGGRGWKTDVTAASELVEAWAELIPVPGTAHPTSYLSFKSRVNEGAVVEPLRLHSSGAAVAGGNFGAGVFDTVILPKFKLHVSGVSNVPSLTAVAGVAAFDTNSTVELTLGGYSSGSFAFWLQTKDNQSAGLGTGASYPLALNPLGGNVGVGAVAPGLFIGGLSASGRALHVMNPAGNAQVIVSAGGSGGLAVLNLEVEDATAGKRVFQTRYDGANNLVKSIFFSAATGAVGQDNVIVYKNDGNIALGNAAPQAKLHVVGRILADPQDMVSVANGNLPNAPLGWYGNPGSTTGLGQGLHVSARQNQTLTGAHASWITTYFSTDNTNDRGSAGEIWTNDSVMQLITGGTACYGRTYEIEVGTDIATIDDPMGPIGGGLARANAIEILAIGSHLQQPTSAIAITTNGTDATNRFKVGVFISRVANYGLWFDTRLGDTGNLYSLGVIYANLTKPFILKNTGDVGIGTTLPAFDGNTSTFLAVAHPTAARFGEIGVGGNATGTTDALGVFAFYNSSLGTTDKRNAAIVGVNNGAVNTGKMIFFTWSAGAIASQLSIEPNNILPGANYTQNLGSSTNKFLSLSVAELKAEVLVAQEKMVTFGGRAVFAPSTVLIAALSSGAVTMDVKHNNLVSGDVMAMEKVGQIEGLKVTSGPTTITGGYRYNITRDFDGSGANSWDAGDAMVTTDMYIDVFSTRSIMSASQVGPTILGSVRNNNTTFTAVSEVWAVGNLKGTYGYASTTFGAAFGKYISGAFHITVDSTNGLRFFDGTATTVAHWNSTVMILGEVAAGKVNTYVSAGALLMRLNQVPYFGIDTSGNVTLGNVATNQGNAFWNNSNKQLEFRGGTAGTVVQAYVSTTGAIAAAAGLMLIDVNGITVRAGTTNAPNRIFRVIDDTSGNVYSNFYGARSLTDDAHLTFVNTVAVTGHDSWLVLESYSASSKESFISLITYDSGSNVKTSISMDHNTITLTNGSKSIILDSTVLTLGSMIIFDGVKIGAPTGGDKGVGSINAVTVWRNGTALDYVFEPDYKRLSISETAAYIKEFRHLPTIPTREVHDKGSINMGALTDRLWETIEVQALMIIELHERLARLEKAA